MNNPSAKNIKSLSYSFLIFTLLIPAISLPQTDSSSYTTKKTVTIIPGEEYQAGELHRFFFGSLWRDLWSTPIEVELLDLNSIAGGLIPFETGGGQQTLSLKLKGKDGREYRFRSVRKKATNILPKEYQDTFAEDLLQDHMSISNPAAPLVAAKLINAVGILQAQPKLYVMPDDEKLGEFREQFAGMLGILEVHPDESENDKPGFAGSDKIIETYTLFENLEEDNDHQVDAAEYLKARLVDIFIGDWDRHVDQWRWAKFEEDGFNMWSPIPKDRDQAFARFDGIFPTVASFIVKRLEGFSDEYNDIPDLTYSGRYIDRRLLVSLSKAQWDSVAAFVKLKLTDEVIIAAVKQLPPEMFEKEGEQLIKDLISRRDKLKEATEIFYRNLSDYVTIRCSNKHEHAEINRISDSEVEVKIFKKDGDTGELKKQIFSRLFNSDETCEIRILLLDGNDDAIITGRVNSSIKVIVSSGNGEDILVDSSIVDGSILGLIPDAENKTFFFINDKKDVQLTKGSSTVVRKENIIELDDDEFKYEPKIKDYGYDWSWDPILALSSDEGLLIGGGRTLYKYDYSIQPYVYRIHFSAAYATEPARFRADIRSRFYTLFEDLITNINFKISGIEVLNFYGFGNETVQNDSLNELDFYNIQQQQFILSPFIELPFGFFSRIRLGTMFKYVQTDKEKNRLITTADVYGLDEFYMQNFFAGFLIDTRNGEVAPTSGYYLNLQGSYYPKYSRQRPAFGKINLDARYHYEFEFPQTSSIAFRAGVEKIWGTFPFFESSFLGGGNTLRGFEDDRFAGDAFIHAGAELRLYITGFSFLFPVRVGINTFFETGRVFAENEHSNLWHNSYGGGVLISLLKRDYTFNLTIAKSDEDIQYYLTTGFAF